MLPLKGKHPYPGTHGLREATTNLRQIRKWWKQWPNANVGIACNSLTGPVVIDIDGPSGHLLLEQLQLPPTREAVSRKGRKHLYYDAMIDGTPIARTIKIKRDGIKHLFDVLGDGGYVIAPPSIHPETGKRYKWTNKRPVAPLPKSILQLVRHHKQGAHTGAAPLPKQITEGERDTLLTSLAGSMRRRGASEEAILAALREENASRVVPPLSDGQLKKIARSIAQKPPAGQGEHYTDMGNARRFIVQHVDMIRSVGGARRPWFIWDGTRWTPDATGEVMRMAKSTVRSLYAEAAQIVDEELRNNLLKHASKSEGSARVHALLDMASTEPEICQTYESFDADPWLFNVENGTLDLKKGKLLKHSKENLITKLAPVEFNPKAEAPRWVQFLHEVMKDDADLIEFLQRMVGYAMTGETREHVLFFCYGQGRNGKSTFLEILRELFGDYSQQSDFTTFLAKKGEGPRNDIAGMRGARLITAVEADHERGFDAVVLKQLTGGDTIRARKLYEEFFEFKPEHKLILAANHKPIVKDQTEAFWSRIKLIPFTVFFPYKDRDKKLKQKLRAELPGILNWALEGCMKWGKKGLGEPSAVKVATRSYREENDLLSEFLLQAAKFDKHSWTSAVEMYRVFGEWWNESRGGRSSPLSMSWFIRAMNERRELVAQKFESARGWKGIAIKREFNA